MQKHRAIFSNATDEDLVLRSQAGDTQAFAELIERHQSSALRLAITILRNRPDAEDEVQNAMAKAYEHIRDFQRGCKFSSWLTRIVVNQCLMRIRQRRRNRLVSMQETPYGENAPAMEFADPAARPDRNLAHEEIRRILDLEIRRIPLLLRRPFLLRHVDNLPMEDVANRLGISVAAAKSRLFRARQELQARLTKHQGRLGPATLSA